MEKKLPHSNHFSDDDIRNRLQDYEVTPSPHIWGRIENELHPSDSKPKGIYWLQNKMLLSGLGLLLFLGFSSTGARYVIKNMLHEYQIEKEVTNTNKASNLELIKNINKNNVVSSNKGREVLSSESNSTLTKLGNYLEAIIPMSAKELEGDDKTTQSKQNSNSRSENTNLAKIEAGSKTDNTNASLFSLMKMNFQHLNQMTTVSTISQVFEEESEVFFASKNYNLKGMYVGPDGGMSAYFATKNNKISNPILGNSVKYNPSLAAKVGLVLGYNINNKVALETRISYLHQKQQFESYKYDAKTNGNLKLTYVEIPLNVKYKVNHLSNKSNLVRSVNISAGIQYAYLAKATLAFPSKISRLSSGTTINPHDYISNHRLGIDAGVDYDLFVSKNLYWTIGIDGSVMGDLTNKNVTTSPTVAIGVHTGIRFFSGGTGKQKK